MPLNSEQQQAVNYLEGPLLVLAGPGTGKTQLLSAKVAHILEKTDANASNILCLTFTEAGAENMRDRLRTMIGKDALDVNIHTYHAFGASLLERYKNYAETVERALDAPVDETTQYKIIKNIQKQLPATDILREAETSDLIETIGNAKAARLNAADLRKIAEQNITDSQDISAEIAPILLAYVPRSKFQVALEGTYQPILEILTKYISRDPIVANIERTANLMARELGQIIKEATAKEKPVLKPLSDWKDRWFEATVTEQGEKTYRLTDTIANKKLLSLANIMACYAEKLEASGLYDFNDMIEQAIHFLKTDAGFRMSLQEQFQYVLLDEFQDTNASQFELIKLITDYEKPLVMAVGDDDQAIFEFQGANASNLMDFREHYDAQIVTLTKNYRSTAEILNFSRQVAAQIENSFAKKYQVDKTLQAMCPAEASAEVSRHEFPGSEAEHYWLAEQVAELIKHGVAPQEIAIIAPRHKNIAPILPYLKAQKIDVTYEKRDNILLDSNIQQIIKLARFIHELASGHQPSHQLLEILSFDFWQLPAEVIIDAVSAVPRGPRNTLDYLQGNPDLEKVASLLAELAKRSFSAPLELWLDFLLGNQAMGDLTMPIHAYYKQNLSTAELLEFYENLTTLRQAILAHIQSEHSGQANFIPKLPELILTANDFDAAGTAINRVSIYRDSSNAVQVMTAHKSKGLEFKYVFLTSVDDSAWGKSTGNNNRLALPRNLLQIRHTGITDDEKLRLFFVAITRAKQHLLLSNAVSKTGGGALARLRYLAESSRDETVALSPFLPEKSRKIQLHLDELDEQAKLATLRLDWISAYQKLQPEIMELLRERMKTYRLSATDLADFVDIIYSGPQMVYQRKILRSPSEPANFSLCYGTLLHAVFERITNQSYSDAAAREFFSQEAPKAALDDTDRLALVEKGLHSLDIALAEFGELVRRPGAKAEVNLSSEKLHLGDIPITGKIDHIEIDPVAKTIEIYDYKTGNFHKEKWDRHPTLYKYRLQLGFYKLLLNLSPTYQKYRVTTGHILFVTPDVEGKVYDKVYEFNDADEAELKQLIEAVYRHLTTLDFLKNPELFLPANKNNTLKDVKAFVEKLITPISD